MSELIRKLKEKKYITKIKIKDDISDELLSKEIPQVGSVKIVAAVKEEIGPVVPEIVVTRETNPELMDICVKYKWAANNDYMTYEEAVAITADMINPDYYQYGSQGGYISKFRTLTHFEEFQWFSGVRLINYRIFENCSSLTSVTIPNSVTSIGGESFRGCTGLTAVTIPSSVTSIDNHAFYSCSGLTSITIPDSVTSIGNSTFQGCTSLSSVTIPNSVTSIGYAAFGGCSSLESIVVENGNSVYDSRDNCNALIETNTNTLILGCKNTIIPNSVTSIGNSTFQGCSGLTSIAIPDSVTLIGEFVFSGCTGLTSVTIPNSVTSIGNSTFQGCSGLTSITIPDSVTLIGEFIFSGCTGLTSITIPNSVTEIGQYAFENCSGLTSITCLATSAPTVYSNSFGNYDSNYTGRNTHDQGINKLKVPSGATGYDTSYWSSTLCNAEKCGFTIEYI